MIKTMFFFINTPFKTIYHKNKRFSSVVTRLFWGKCQPLWGWGLASSKPKRIKVSNSGYNAFI